MIISSLAKPVDSHIVSLPLSDWKQKSRNFIKANVTPYANKYALEGKLPPELIKSIAENGFLGTLVNPTYGGLGIDFPTYGTITEEFGFGCSSARSLLTVHDMVAYAIEHFGNEQQKSKWLPKLVCGQVIAAFALSEPMLGSSINKLNTRIEVQKGKLRLFGKKVWISFGQIADLILVFAKYDNRPVAVLVPSSEKNISINAIDKSFGMPASMLAEVLMEGVEIDESQILGSDGLGISFIANQCLMLGRYSVAYGCCGIIRACLEACTKKVTENRPDGNMLINYQIIAGMMTDMFACYKVTSLLCADVGEKLQNSFYSALEDVMLAKYLSAKNAFKVASNALQVFGAEGYRHDSSINRLFQDAKVAELIEGSNELLQATIGKLIVNSRF